MAITIALPLTDGLVSSHFGHCEVFAFYTVDDDGTVTPRGEQAPPAHAPGVFPAWLKEQGVDVVLAGGMGPRAQGLFDQVGIRTVVGVQPGPVEPAVRAYAAGQLEAGDNTCSH